MLSLKYPVYMIACMAFLLVFSVTSALAADANERRFIRQGMSEGDVLMKLGKPDSESVDTAGGATIVTKRWLYLPTSGDEQVLTTIVLEGGRVIQVIRQVSY